jgi:hypothetical protein
MKMKKKINKGTTTFVIRPIRYVELPFAVL